MHNSVTPKKAARFLLALEQTGNVTKACELAKIQRRTIYRMRDDSNEFALAWDIAKLIGAEALEDEAIRRAHDGVDEPVFYQGKAVGAVKKYSDTLLIFLLKGAMPKYREYSKIDLNSTYHIASLTDEQLESELMTLSTTLNHGRDVTGHE